MKNIYFLFIAVIFVVSCSNDDDSNSTENNNTSGVFIPTATGNYWVYDVQSEIINGKDSLYVAGDTIIENKSYKKLKAKDAIAYGFLSNALNNNGVRQSEGRTYLSGTAGLSLSEELPFNLSVSDFVIFDANAANSQQLDVINGTLNEEIEGFDVEFNYTLTSTAREVISSFTSGSEQYSNVKPVEITLNLSINVTIQPEGIPIPLTYPIMSPQNVVISTQYYAQDIGAVKTVTDINYQINQIPGVELGIPQSGFQHQEEVLTNYSVD